MPDADIDATLFAAADAIFALHVKETLRMMHARGLFASADAECIVADYEEMALVRTQRRYALRRMRSLLRQPPIEHREAAHAGR